MSTPMSTTSPTTLTASASPGPTDQLGGVLTDGTASTVAAVVLLGLSAGFFVTYTISVTRGLAVVGDPAYVESFQAINDRVRTASFATFFFGAAPMALLAAVQQRGAARVLLLLAVLVYLVGVIGVTFAGNIPLNDALAEQTDPAGWSAARAAFEERWNQLNAVRSGSSLLALVLGTLALALGRRIGG